MTTSSSGSDSRFLMRFASWAIVSIDKSELFASFIISGEGDISLVFSAGLVGVFCGSVGEAAPIGWMTV